MKKFAELFTDETLGQVLVLCDENDNYQPVIRFSVRCKMGVVSIDIGFEDSLEGEEKRDIAFAKIGRATALKTARNLLDTIED